MYCTLKQQVQIFRNYIIQHLMNSGSAAKWTAAKGNEAYWNAAKRNDTPFIAMLTRDQSGNSISLLFVLEGNGKQT